MQTGVKHRYRAPDLAAFPADGRRYEIIEGALEVAPSPRTIHQLVSVRLVAALARFTAVAGGHVFHAPFDVHLAEDTVVQPDLLYLAPEHLDRIRDDGVHGPPDLVVEILSPTSRRWDLREKRAAYARHGVREYWLVDPDARTIAVLQNVGGRFAGTTYAAGDTARSPAVLEGFALDVDATLA